MRWETFTCYYGKFNQENIHQTLSKSASFCDKTKHLGVFFGSAVHLQNANAKFHKVVWRHYSGEVEKFTLLCDKFTQGNMHQILSESVRFCRRYDKNARRHVVGQIMFGM